MMKKLMMATALSGLMAGAAAAQSAPPPAPATPPAATERPMAPPSAAPTTAPGASAQFINSQRPDQYLASKFRGTDVIGADDKKIGDVSDILFDKDGKIEAYVVSVGGFLGMGAKDVALAPSSFQVVPGDKSKNESDKLKLSMTQEQIKQAATFEPYSPPRTTTGAGTGSPRPAAPAR